LLVALDAPGNVDQQVVDAGLERIAGADRQLVWWAEALSVVSQA
jgi:hypothetical protein